ncbi:HelD family protein [Flexivirga meconopsidis]|uniref:HelD family protein n=1 Tax=Flexivirga meconopsidis TaxID=2977121 RepID=UPI00223EAE85|nr:UvrD-helicase domain-containing protein [Flexivirga meconopsidis]
MSATPPASRSTATTEEQVVLDRAYNRREELLVALDGECDNSDNSPADATDAARLASLRRRRAELRQAESGLIFGRLDATDGTTRRLGRVGLAREDEGDEPLVLDWRAPAARPFYTASPLDPQGQRRRRHIRTQGRQVVGVDDEPLDSAADSGDLVGEGALLAALSARRTGAMGTAVATLQREQDEIVRSDSRGPLVVQGGPGTGKTVVALHRVAYLLFTHQELASQGVLVLGPSRRFLDYIAQVLPALGETSVVSATCDTLLPGVAVSRGESRETAELKGRACWQDILSSYVGALAPVAAPLTFVVDSERHTLPTASVERALHTALAGRDLHSARAWFTTQVHDLLTDDAVSRHEALLAAMEEGFEDILARVDAGLQRADDRGVRTGATGSDVDGGLTDQDVDRLRSRIANDPAIQQVIDAFWPVRDIADTLRALLGDADLLRRHGPSLTPHERRLITEEPDAFAPSDIPLLDALAELLGSADDRPQQGEFLADRALATRDWGYGHVVVDEAQELSQMQWRMVLRRVPSRSITAVGDIDQTEAPHRHTSWESAVGEAFGDRWRRSDLTICYRTPREVMALTDEVLRRAGSHNAPPRAVRSSGIDPWAVSVAESDLHRTVADLALELSARWSGGTVGVVAPGPRSAALRESLERQGIGVPVLTPTEAKGLEWDAALVVDQDGITAEPRGWNALYVAFTRCTQELGQVVVS